MLTTIDDNKLIAIGDAIRERNGTTDKYTTDEMPNAIKSLIAGADISKLVDRSIAGIYKDDTIEEIGYGAFHFCSQLEGVDCANVDVVKPEAFYQCNNLKTVNLPKAVIIGDHAFASSGITNVSFPNAGRINSDAFTYCRGLREIKLPSVYEIAVDAFTGCDYLNDIYIGAAEGEITGAPWGASSATIHYNYTE